MAPVERIRIPLDWTRYFVLNPLRARMIRVLNHGLGAATHNGRLMRAPRLTTGGLLGALSARRGEAVNR